MSDLALSASTREGVATIPILQHTGVASAAVFSGAPIYYVAATGKVAHADGNGSPPINSVAGVTTHAAAAGEAVTFIILGFMDLWDVSALDYGAGVYLSDTVGILADAAGTTPTRVGTVVPVFGTQTGTGADKIVLVDCTAGARALAGVAAAAGITPLTDSSGGSANNTVQAIGGTYSQTEVANNFADVTAKINEIIAALA